MTKLKVLHISTADNVGGSGRSAYKIHTGLRHLGVESRMLVSQKSTKDPDVGLISTGLLRVTDKIAGRIGTFTGLHYLFYPSSLALFRHPWYEEADIVQLYNTHGNYFSHSILPFIRGQKKVVWRLSDLWPMTGHCAYSGTCGKWISGCHGCPDLSLYPSVPWDSSALLWKWKQFVYGKGELHIVPTSTWTKYISERSPLFYGFAKTLISNGINAEIFHPMNKEECRRELGIALDKKIILYSAHSLADNPRKGGPYFIKAINRLVESGHRDLQVMLVGEGAHQWGLELKTPVWRRESVQDDMRLAQIYNAADILVHPATMENLPNSILEAQGCGVPSVAFDNGGVKDIVKHRKTGYLAACEDIEDLIRGIVWLLESNSERKACAEECRKQVLDSFTVEKQAGAFYGLYERLLAEKNRR